MTIKLSSEQALFQKILLDNLFIIEYMPYAPEGYVKVYLYGLSLACSSSSENSASIMARRLNMDENEICEAYCYWQEQGLVNVVSTDPVSVEYLPVRREKPIKKFSKEKYKSFNDQLHAMLPERMILPNEYNEYYSIMENLHIDVDAMLAIIAYCVRYKGKDIGYPYVLAVARNLAHEGYTSYEGVTARLDAFDLNSGEIATVMKAMGSRRTPDINDRRLYEKWTKNLGFLPETVVKTAKLIKKGGMEKLDALLTRMYEKHAMSYGEIESYIAERDSLFALAKEITRRLGVYYENLDYFIETYIIKWKGFGFDELTLQEISAYCFKRSIRTAEGMDSLVEKYFKMGLTSLATINEYLSALESLDEKIKDVLEKSGTKRNVTDWDRNYFRTWTQSWSMPFEVILYAAEKAMGKGGMAYLNSLLSHYNSKNAHTLDEVKKISYEQKTTTVVTRKSADEINALLFSLKDDEL